ncbi:high nitrogen upregulated cytochrome P450 monooxygenase 2 [Mycena polygramma]|nr:high nitrogen upregulated cytochrome P450 monooxygenase 2 [Mycena polygramma]
MALQLNHAILHRYEPPSANTPLVFLAVEPVALLLFNGGLYSCARLLWSYIVFWGSLSLSVLAYRLSPFHPLAQYPGPAIGKATKLWSLWISWRGYKYIYHKQLHDTYGPYVRTGERQRGQRELVMILSPSGPNELSVNRSTPPTVVGLIGEAHTAKRRVWNRAMTSAARREYEPLIANRASQLVSYLGKQDGPVDLVAWFDLFALDLMGDFAFGGGFELMRDGDVAGVGQRIRATAGAMSGQIPWILKTLHLFPQVGRMIQEFNDFGQSLAIQRTKDGASDEAGLEKEKPTLESSAADGVLAVVAGSDTTASVMSGLVWFLLSNRDCTSCLHACLSRVFFFHFCAPIFTFFLTNETLRLHPPVPSGGTRQVNPNEGGRNIAGRFIPEGTNIYTPAYSLHRNPKVFSHPDRFIPDRWLPGSSFEKHDTSAFIPFSLGAANCVGQKFAKHKMLMVLTILLKSFDIQFA